MLSCYVAYGALVARPRGTWDEQTLTGIEFASALLVALGVSAFLLALLPVRRRALSPWWLAPPLVFLAVGAARWAYVALAYPQGPGG
ncbi:hypothetical protein EIZ62_04890 [Streptomyces ficellus]|uniref:Uncharacterized protein n=1 Tax=Streptomyces ficellus TaxID=1977088 RepID=A0A6I6FGK5_9ACTN|nr:hypothetical protein EIZ62_04890 [Streptomyces ficellus]